MLVHSAEAPLRVLLVDDDKKAHSLVKALLSGSLQHRFDLTWVSTYSDGLEAISSSRFDVCLLDYELGEHNGLELLAEARRKSVQTEIIFFTGKGNIYIDINANHGGATDYLVKQGLTAAALERALRYAIERGRATSRLRRLLSEKDVLIKEVHHRVKNNLQIICSLLALQIESVGAGLSAGPLREAHGRVVAMSIIHEYLYRSDAPLTLDFAQYLRALAIRLFEAYCVDPERIQLALESEPIQLVPDDAIACGLIVNELLSNSLKHAFNDGREGLLRISLRQLPSGTVELTVADNGVGLPADFHFGANRSLGWRIIRTLVDQMGAQLHFVGEGGMRITIAWQPPPFGEVELLEDEPRQDVALPLVRAMREVVP